MNVDRPNPIRLERLRAALDVHDVAGMLIGFPADIRYLTGFDGHDSLLLVDRETALIISDSRYDEALDPWRQFPETDVHMGVRHRLHEAIQALCGSRKLARVAFQAEHFTVARLQAIEDGLRASRLVPVTGLVGELRQRKDEAEIAAIQRAIGVQQAALDAALGGLRVGMREIEFCALLEFEMKSRGSSAASFPPIIAAGANSSIPHHSPGERRIEEGTLLVDWGATVDGYCSDLTRTFAVGAFPAKVAEIYAIVLEAQLAAIDAIAPDRTCAEIDAVARRVITDAGYGAEFNHGLGHSFGLEIHEGPYFNDLETDTRLEPGMVMTVEPGIYLPGVGGVRIEDDIVVTDRGCRVLSDAPKGLDAMTIAPAVIAT